MAKWNGGALWRNMEIRFGGARGRVPIHGWLAANFETRVFAGSGNGRTQGRVRRSSTTITASTAEQLREGGMRMQTYWRLQYDLDIGGLTRLARKYRIANLLNTRVTGLNNIIQTFDILPGRGRTQDYEVTFRNVRGDRRGGSMSAWEFDLSHDRRVTYSRNMASISTTTVARLPVNFSGSMSSEVSTQIGAEISLEPAGVGVAGNASAGTAAGASIDMSFRRTLELRLIAENLVPVRM